MQLTTGAYERTPPVWSGPGAAGRYFDLLHNLVTRAIKQRYKRSVLGFTWMMLKSLLTVVFSAVFGRIVPSYPLFAIIGLLAWSLFCATIVDAGSLIRKVVVPGVPYVIGSVREVAAPYAERTGG